MARNQNQVALRRLYMARHPGLLARIPDRTIRRHIEEGRIGNGETLAFYATLGMPVDAWPKKPRKQRKVRRG